MPSTVHRPPESPHAITTFLLHSRHAPAALPFPPPPPAPLQAELSALMSSEGFVCEANIMHTPTIQNRKTGVEMARRWIQAVFRYDPDTLPPQPPDAPILPQLQPPPPQQQQQQQSEEGVTGAGAHGSNGVAAAAAAAPGSNAGSSVVGIECAGHAWLLPSSLAAAPATCGSSDSSGGSSGSCCVCIAEALAGLVAQQQVQLLGRVLLLLPPWLTLHSQQQQHDSTVQQQQHVHAQQTGVDNLLWVAQLQQGAQAFGPSCCTKSSSSSEGWGSTAADVARQQGAAAALLSLVAVWMGARRVYACLPGTSMEPAGLQQQAGQQGCLDPIDSSSSCNMTAAQCYSGAFHAVLGLNECRVVVERIRPKRWQQDSSRQALVLQQELLGVLQRGLPAGNGLVVLGASCSSSCAGSSSTAGNCSSGSVEGHVDHPVAQQLLGAVCHSDAGCRCVLVCRCSCCCSSLGAVDWQCFLSLRSRCTCFGVFVNHQ